MRAAPSPGLLLTAPRFLSLVNVLNRRRHHDQHSRKMTEQSPVILKRYTGNQSEALAAFQADAIVMQAQSCFPTSQTWVPGSHGFGLFIVGVVLCPLGIGIALLLYLIISTPAGALSVMYERRGSTAALPIS